VKTFGPQRKKLTSHEHARFLQLGYKSLRLIADQEEIFRPPACSVLSVYQEKIPARNTIYAHAQDFAASDELLVAILKTCIQQPLNKQQTIGFRMF
jgi:hypothetical protein